MSELDPRVASLLAEGRALVHLATVLPDGAPHSIPVWAILEAGRIGFFTQPASRKARNLARDPRVALSVVDEANPYRNAQIRGRVVETVEGEPALAVIDRISQRYIGRPFPLRSGVVFWVEPETARFVELPFEH